MNLRLVKIPYFGFLKQAQRNSDEACRPPKAAVRVKKMPCGYHGPMGWLPWTMVIGPNAKRGKHSLFMFPYVFKDESQDHT